MRDVKPFRPPNHQNCGGARWKLRNDSWNVPSAALTIHLKRLAGTTTKATTKRSVGVAGRSSPRPCNWSGRPVRSIPITENDDDFLPTFFMYGDHSPRRDGRIRHFIDCQTHAISKASHAVEGTASTLFEAIALVLKAIGTDK